MIYKPKGGKSVNTQKLILQLNDKSSRRRLEALAALKAAVERGELEAVPVSEDVNNHIHTTYSFSPYSPTAAVWMACRAGLKTAGIMDHDSVGGAKEFIEAGRMMGLMTTVGVECRVKMTGTPIADKRINNPDQKGVAYMALHGASPTEKLTGCAPFS